MRIVTIAALAAVLLATVLLPAQLRAQNADARRCLTQEQIASEARLSACTAAIESGEPRARPGLLIGRGNALAVSGNYDLAIADYAKAIELAPGNAVALNNRGLAYQRKSDNDRAIEDYDAAIRSNPTYAMAFANRANARRAKGRLDLAIADGEQAVALGPNLAAAFLARAAAFQDKSLWDFDGYLADGKYEERAIADYDTALRLTPNNAFALRNRAILNNKLQRYDRAIADFTEAIRLEPAVAAAFQGRALALRYVGQYEQAVADYRQALTLKLDDASRRQIETILRDLAAANGRDGAAAGKKR